MDRYDITFASDDSLIEYFIRDRKLDREVSFSLVLTLDRFAQRLYVAKFYPGLYRQEGCRYLSATCFYLMVHHFGRYFGLTSQYRIYLRTQLAVHTEFYATLGDFDFSIGSHNVGDQVDLVSPYLPSDCDTSMILPVTLELTG